MGFHLILTPLQKEELSRALEITRNAGDFTMVNRILVILAYAERLNSIEAIAGILRVSVEFVRAWVKKYISGGIKALTFRKRQPGHPNKLSKTQRRELEKIIEQGPQKAGFFGACWRTPMIQTLI